MTSATHKFNRSGFTQTISVINLIGRMRLAAQFDFWRSGGLVCAMGDPDQMRSGVVDELNWSASLLWQFFLTEELFSGKLAVQLIRK
jgi:hypothetical protein